MKKVVVCLFLSIIFLPTILAVGTMVSGKTLDIPLNGYTDSIEKPQFSLDSFWNGQFQSNYMAWYQGNFQPRGVFIKNYSTIRYNLFREGSSGIIGKNYDIFQAPYIYAELCIEGYSDFSQPEAQRQVQEYVSKLEVLKEKLEKYGKMLYVIITPSKADFYRENIPDKYLAISSASAVSGQDYMAEVLEETDIPHIVCADYKDKLSFPDFYRSGIHWSRTFEQEVFAEIINNMSTYLGKNFPTIELETVMVQDTPFWQDADVLDLQNTWNSSAGTYYQYNIKAVYPENYDEFGVLFQGTSFSQGFLVDFSATMPLENVIYINREINFNVNNSGFVPFETYDELNLSAFLDQVDAVVLEVLPSELEQYSYGFVEALLDTLETYVPESSPRPEPMFSLDVTSSEEWDLTYLRGFYDREPDHVWTRRDSQVTIKDPTIKQTGLELNYTVPEQFFRITDSANVKIYVNGVRVMDLDYREPWNGSVVLSPEQLAFVDGDVYVVRLECDTMFIPAETDSTNDTRELALYLTYIGRKR